VGLARSRWNAAAAAFTECRWLKDRAHGEGAGSIRARRRQMPEDFTSTSWAHLRLPPVHPGAPRSINRCRSKSPGTSGAI
jgi:hypothetical protein